MKQLLKTMSRKLFGVTYIALNITEVKSQLSESEHYSITVRKPLAQKNDFSHIIFDLEQENPKANASVGPYLETVFQDYGLRKEDIPYILGKIADKKLLDQHVLNLNIRNNGSIKIESYMKGLSDLEIRLQRGNGLDESYQKMLDVLKEESWIPRSTISMNQAAQYDAQITAYTNKEDAINSFSKGKKYIEAHIFPDSSNKDDNAHTLEIDMKLTPDEIAWILTRPTSKNPNGERWPALKNTTGSAGREDALRTLIKNYFQDITDSNLPVDLYGWDPSQGRNGKNDPGYPQVNGKLFMTKEGLTYKAPTDVAIEDLSKESTLKKLIYFAKSKENKTILEPIYGKN